MNALNLLYPQDEISYIVAIGVVDQLAAYLSSVMGQIDSSPSLAYFLLSVMQFLSALTGVAEVLVKAPARANVPPSDPTHLLHTFQVTDLAGTVSMLYGMLLHQDTPMRDEKAVPPKLPPHTTAVAQTTSQLLYRVVGCRKKKLYKAPLTFTFGQKCDREIHLLFLAFPG